MNEDLGESHMFAWDFNGAEEYAIYGWAKWTPIKNRSTWH
jgi:hypothetical protein